MRYEPQTGMRPYGGEGRHGLFTPGRVLIESEDGTVVKDCTDPRAAFVGHTRSTPWDPLHRRGIPRLCFYTSGVAFDPRKIC